MSYCLLFCVLFFFKRKTAYEMRISDWSSDVCSSDLLCLRARGIGFGEQALALRAARKRLIKRAGRIGVRDRRVIDRDGARIEAGIARSEEHTSELQSLMRISYAVFCLKKKNHTHLKRT